ncbi:putative D-tyrosyl-tRNATyr deacylase 2 [Reticulomyxa filosa]|uniref:Putative D-tyrosyl-tRNATyr deacylase 2 n=1 Tax=Reticulomyxa filosa TaxID=46433 RepID=X6MJT9_RETFI|nr:putative D-tyrosyl-tRNATyr deacylase 2 [Reticulomyxa filosa]|eukprot:ETO14134.1 putative D-tyrosyl-tRNATyr deacylase 2 [Reticulomyxa filosa]
MILYVSFLKPATNEEIDMVFAYMYMYYSAIFLFVYLFKFGWQKKLVNRLLKKKLFRLHKIDKNDTRKNVSILVIPQFSLGGKMQSGASVTPFFFLIARAGVQYHSVENNEKAQVLYGYLIDLLKEQTSNTANKQEMNLLDHIEVKHGTFGNRQALEFVSDGPFTHTFDIGVGVGADADTHSSSAAKVHAPNPPQRNASNLTTSNTIRAIDELLKIMDSK